MKQHSFDILLLRIPKQHKSVNGGILNTRALRGLIEDTDGTVVALPYLNINANKQLVEMELARDYHAGGLWDRAEKLLDQIVHRKGTQEMPALELLRQLPCRLDA